METTRDAARLTGVSERTIRRWAVSSRLTYRKRGRWLLVNPLEVSELAELRQQSGRLPSMPGSGRRLDLASVSRGQTDHRQRGCSNPVQLD